MHSTHDSSIIIINIDHSISLLLFIQNKFQWYSILIRGSMELSENNTTLVCWDWLDTLEINHAANPIAVKVLEILYNDNIKQCIVSNGSIHDIKLQLHRYKLEKYFDMIAGIELNLPLKPNIDMLYHCARVYADRYHIPFAQIKLIFVGDSSNDRLLVQNAVRSGLKCEYVDIQQIHQWMNI